MIVALDTPDVRRATELVGCLAGVAGSFKIGLELFSAAGPAAFEAVREAGAERIFGDLKLCDIPNTVTGAIRALARRNLWLLTVHALGGVSMMRAARQAAEEGGAAAGCTRPRVIAVTLLTSLDDHAARDELGLHGPVATDVVRLAALARAAGLDGVVASPQEAAAIRTECGPEFLIVTPGIRVRSAECGVRNGEDTSTTADPPPLCTPHSALRTPDDQRRTMTPAEAFGAGADYLVIGRPITAAPDPRAAAAAVAAEIARAREARG